MIERKSYIEQYKELLQEQQINPDDIQIETGGDIMRPKVDDNRWINLDTAYNGEFFIHKEVLDKFILSLMYLREKIKEQEND